MFVGQINIDMDGVVADFDAAIVKMFGEEGLDRHADKFWKETCVAEQAFTHMEPIMEGMEMVGRLINAKLPICFVTSTGGMPHHIDIAMQKLDWLRKHGLGQYPVAFCMNTIGKGLFAAPGKILIDDRQKVVDAWVKNGGEGILFTRSSARAITDTLLSRLTP